MIKLYYTHLNCDSEEFIKKSLYAFSGKNDYEIKRTQNGKPYVDSDIHFSLSHTDSLTVCAVSYGAVGVDAEKIRSIKNKERILERYTGQKALSDEDFLRKWTAFESAVKFFGEKLTSYNKANEHSRHIETFNMGEYVVSVCSDEKEEIKKERL